MAEKIEFSKYERARILGARGLQISMDAPLLIKIDEKQLDNFNFDPLHLAEVELDSGVLPISVNRPMPHKREEDLDRIKVDVKIVSDEKKEETEKSEEQEISEGGDIMALANPDDEESEKPISNSNKEE